MIKFYIENFTIKRHTEFTRINAHFLGGIFRYMIRLCKQEEEIFDFFNQKWKNNLIQARHAQGITHALGEYIFCVFQLVEKMRLHKRFQFQDLGRCSNLNSLASALSDPGERLEPRQCHLHRPSSGLTAFTYLEQF